MPMGWQNLVSRIRQPVLGRPDRVLELTNQGRAFKQIKQQIDHDELSFEDALFHVLPTPLGISSKVGRRFKEGAATGFALLTDGMVSQGWRSVIRSASRLVPVFYVHGLDLFFMRFERETEEDPEPDLVVHVVTILDAREAWRDWSEDVSKTAGIDALDYFLGMGLLTCSKVLPDNSRASWERYASKSTLVPDFEALLGQLEGPMG
jgi:hypothetical protein